MASRPLTDTRRVDTDALPYASWRCLGMGHRWTDPASVPVSGWGEFVDSVEEIAECDCGRWRRDVVDAATGQVLTRDYGGGVMVWAGSQPSRQEARVWLINEKRRRRMAAVRSAG